MLDGEVVAENDLTERITGRAHDTRRAPAVAIVVREGTKNEESLPDLLDQLDRAGIRCFVEMKTPAPAQSSRQPVASIISSSTTPTTSQHRLVVYRDNFVSLNGARMSLKQAIKSLRPVSDGTIPDVDVECIAEPGLPGTRVMETISALKDALLASGCRYAGPGESLEP